MNRSLTGASMILVAIALLACESGPRVDPTPPSQPSRPDRATDHAAVPPIATRIEPSSTLPAPNLPTAPPVVVPTLGPRGDTPPIAQTELPPFRPATPTPGMRIVATDDVPVCMTEGTATRTRNRLRISDPATRGVLPGSTGDSGTLLFHYRGPSSTTSTLASGDARAQLGLKLRAQDSCNLVYVMWRLEPVNEIVVQVKRNADAHTHDDCGTDGYARVRPTKRSRPPKITNDDLHSLYGVITGDHLEVLADDVVVWRGDLPESARDLRGQTGFRTDNVDVELDLVASATGPTASCDQLSARSAATR